MNGKSFRLRMCKASWHKPPGTQFHKVWIQGGRMFLHHLLLRLGFHMQFQLNLFTSAAERMWETFKGWQYFCRPLRIDVHVQTTGPS